MENLHITVEIKAPEIVDALEILALAISNQSKLLNPRPAPQNASSQEVHAEPEPEQSKEVKNTASSDISVEKLRAKFVELSKKGKKAELKKLLSELGVSKVSDIKPDQYQDVMAKLEAI